VSAALPESKERLLAAGKALVLAHGYAGTRVDSICEKAGLTTGSFYHFFKSKEEIGIAILEWAMLKGGEILANGPYVKMSDPVEQSFAFLEHVENSSEALWANGCILASFSMELADTSERLNQIVIGMFTQVMELFAARFEPIAERWPELPSAKELANEYLALLEGSIILAKVYRDSSRIATALRAFRQNLERLTTAPA
jgi:TetR/AcrR family transcriptional repressor of nem operon